jgi:hypothetical protein
MGRIGHDLHHHLGRGPGVDPAARIMKADAPPSGRDLDRHRVGGGAMGRDPVGQFHGARAHHAVLPADDQLRRVDHRGTRRAAIAILAIGKDGLRKRVFPAEVVPVIDMQRQGDDVVARGESCIIASAGGQAAQPWLV